jgi:hypothetical protein
MILVTSKKRRYEDSQAYLLYSQFSNCVMEIWVCLITGFQIKKKKIGVLLFPKKSHNRRKRERVLDNSILGKEQDSRPL